MRTPRALVCIMIVLTSLVSADTALAGRDCYCRTSTGEHVEVGKLACMETSDGPKEARCGFVLNNTAWKFTGNTCPVASNDGRRDAQVLFAELKKR